MIAVDPLPEHKTRNIVWELLDGVQHLHTMNIVHLDLKVCVYVYTNTQKFFVCNINCHLMQEILFLHHYMYRYILYLSMYSMHVYYIYVILGYVQCACIFV